MRIRIEQTNPPKPRVVLAEAVENIGKAAKELHDSGLNEEAVVILLHHKTKIGMRQIQTVLDGLRQLQGWYCREGSDG